MLAGSRTPLSALLDDQGPSSRYALSAPPGGPLTRCRLTC